MSTQILHTTPDRNRLLASVSADCPPPKKKYERAKLQTAVDIGNEMARIYRLAKSGELDASTATKLTYILQSLAKLRVDSDLENRISTLEDRSH